MKRTLKILVISGGLSNPKTAPSICDILKLFVAKKHLQFLCAKKKKLEKKLPISNIALVILHNTGSRTNYVSSVVNTTYNNAVQTIDLHSTKLEYLQKIIERVLPKAAYV